MSGAFVAMHFHDLDGVVFGSPLYGAGSASIAVTAVVPEPASAVAAAIGLAGLLLRRRGRRG